MMSEVEILALMDRLIDVIREETSFLKAHEFRAALHLLEKKELLHLKHVQITTDLQQKNIFSPYFIDHFKEKNALLKQVAKENSDILEMVITANTRLINSVIGKLNEKNRPHHMYGAGARPLNMDKRMPPSMTLNERL